jgi:two-component system LytT family sensor kinase
MRQQYLGYRFVFIHVCCWAGYILYEQLAVFVVSSPYHLSAGTLFFYLINIGLFYFQNAILKRTIAGSKPDYVLAACMTILGLCAFTGLKIIGELFFSNEKREYLYAAGVFQKTNILNLVRSFFYMVSGTAYWAVIHSIRLRKQAADERIKQLTMEGINADLQVKLANAQNAYLQQQINPHLLFNTLNFVYSTVHKHAPDGGHAIFLLTEILDFSLRKNDEKGRTGLGAEIEQIHNLIALNRYRFDFELRLKFTMTGDPSAHRIIPLVLLTLVENMFVHGDFNHRPAAITMAVSADGQLQVETQNAINSKSIPSGRGSGLNNIRTRLEHAYPGRFRLSYSRTGEHFLTNLAIQL